MGKLYTESEAGRIGVVGVAAVDVTRVVDIAEIVAGATVRGTKPSIGPKNVYNYAPKILFKSFGITIFYFPS